MLRSALVLAVVLITGKELKQGESAGQNDQLSWLDSCSYFICWLTA